MVQSYIPFFVSMVRQGKLTIEQVPERWRADVESTITEQTA